MGAIVIRAKNADRNTLFDKQSDEYKNVDVFVLPEDQFDCYYSIDGKLNKTPIEVKTKVFSNLGFLAFKNVADIKVCYIAKDYQFNVEWGTSNKIEFRDPQTDVAVSVGCHGTAYMKVADTLKIYESLIGPDSTFTAEKLASFVRTRIQLRLTDIISNTIYNNNLAYTDYSRNVKKLSDLVTAEIRSFLFDEYGLIVKEFAIEEVYMDDDDKNAIENSIQSAKKEIKSKIEKEEKEQERIKARETARKEMAEDKAIEREDREWELGYAKKIKELENLEANEVADRLEKANDKDFEREYLMALLESGDKEKYYEVQKAIEIAKANANANIARDAATIMVSAAKVEADIASNKKDSQYCPNCGAPIANGAKFCSGCGKEVSGGKKTCPKCGTENDSGAKFCSNCGTSF